MNTEEYADDITAIDWADPTDPAYWADGVEKDEKDEDGNGVEDDHDTDSDNELHIKCRRPFEATCVKCDTAITRGHFFSWIRDQNSSESSTWIVRT